MTTAIATTAIEPTATRRRRITWLRRAWRRRARVSGRFSGSPSSSRQSLAIRVPDHRRGQPMPSARR
jgi:hypothetical protein